MLQPYKQWQAAWNQLQFTEKSVTAKAAGGTSWEMVNMKGSDVGDTYGHMYGHKTSLYS